jgi:hypothetical protein
MLKMKFKCLWCGIKKEDLFEEEIKYKNQILKAYFCNKKHINETIKFIQFAEKHYWHFFIGIIVFFIVGLIIMLNGFINLGALIALAGLGLTIIIFPFATPQTNELLGLKRSIIIVRFLGIICILIGVVFFLL